MTGKERAALRAKANGLETIIQIGKSGITDTVINQIDGALTARELIKVRTLEYTPLTTRECADLISEKTGADVVQVIGTKIVLYRYSQELHDKEAEKKKNIKKMKDLQYKKIREKISLKKRQGRTNEDRNSWR